MKRRQSAESLASRGMGSTSGRSGSRANLVDQKRLEEIAPRRRLGLFERAVEQARGQRRHARDADDGGVLGLALGAT